MKILDRSNGNDARHARKSAVCVFFSLSLRSTHQYRFDIGNGKRERGRQTLANFRGEGDINHPDVIAEYDEIIAAVGTFPLTMAYVLCPRLTCSNRARVQVPGKHFLPHGDRIQEW